MCLDLKTLKPINGAWCSPAVHQRRSALHTPYASKEHSHDTRSDTNSLSPLDSMDPNIPPRQLSGKSQAVQQPLSRAQLPSDCQVSEAPAAETATSAAGGLSHITRPPLTVMPSFQRPRKRVIWRNKACFIALPLEDEFGRSTSRESYLSPDDVEGRLKVWENHGFDTNGFTLAPQTSDLHSPRLEGQSRAMHPDPEDEKRERADGTYRVSIPDRQNWVSTPSRKCFPVPDCIFVY